MIPHNGNIESEFLITDSQLLYKINGVEKIYSLNDIKIFKEGKVLVKVILKEKDGTITPIIFNKLLAKERDKLNNLVNSIKRRCDGLESIQIEKEKEKAIKKKFKFVILVYIISAYPLAYSLIRFMRR